MTDQQDLTTLSIKDLRHLAGEHHIQNRSRLGKDDLIEALKAVLTGASAQLAATADAAPAIADAAAQDYAALAGSGHAPVAVTPVVPVAAAAEPELITPDLVADIESPAVPHAPSRPADAEPEVLDAAAVAGLDQAPGGEGERRRRRRRRGRGRGRRDGAPGFDQRPGGAPLGADGLADDGPEGAEGDEVEEGQPAAISNGAPLAQQGAPPSQQGAQPLRDPRQQGQPNQNRFQPQAQRGQGQPHHREPHQRGGQHHRGDIRGGDQRGSDQRGNDQRGHEQRGGDNRPGQPRPADGRFQDQRPPRPRLDGMQRPMPSVLDRLCVFTKGILELCDPTTPTWAQARLSELLAETGVVPMPAAGVPHPDYHTVIGTSVAAEVAAGAIAVVESPGFALRGDRGDLFPLRKAQVRVAGSERRDGAPVAEAFNDRAPPASAPAVAGSEAPSSIPEASPVGQDGIPAVSEAAMSEGSEQAATTGLIETTSPPEDLQPRHHDDAEGDPDPKALSAAPARPIPAADRAPQGRPPERNDERRRDGRNDRRRGELPIGPHHGNEPSGDAPALPLVTQVPDELAARPKAEGFRALGLNDQILADLAGIGYQQPTPIQAEAIPQVLSGKDLLGQAQTGTGKTAAFALPILQKLYAIENPERKPVALVLCPTRELARQVFNEFNKMAGASGARAVCIYGGTPMDDQCRALERHPHVVVGTPGRIIDHMKRHTLDLSHLSIAVLDEADQMLDIGFWPDVNYIIGHTPPSRQMLLFSATFPDPVKELAAKHMKEPAHIRITPKIVTVEQVDQKYIAVARERKNELLAYFIETQKPEQLVVFCKTKHQTDRVAEVLKRKNMSAAAIHGDLPQSKRERTLQAFRNSELQCLIATNVAARGLDIPTVSHVVNYDIPEMPEEYVHRIVRTARNGAKGIARTFITPEDGQFLLEIEKHIGLLLEEEKIEGFSAEHTNEVKRTIADLPAGAPRILKPLVGGIRLGRRRR